MRSSSPLLRSAACVALLDAEPLEGVRDRAFIALLSVGCGMRVGRRGGAAVPRGRRAAWRSAPPTVRVGETSASSSIRSACAGPTWRIRWSSWSTSIEYSVGSGSTISSAAFSWESAGERPCIQRMSDARRRRTRFAWASASIACRSRCVPAVANGGVRVVPMLSSSCGLLVCGWRVRGRWCCGLAPRSSRPRAAHRRAGGRARRSRRRAAGVPRRRFGRR